MLTAMRLRCLIVDDSPDLLRAASELLQGEGVEIVAVATTGAEALRLVPDLSPDVVLVDIDLGAESGFELIRRLDSAAPGHPSIVISTYDQEDFDELIQASSAIGFLPKSALSAEAIRRLLEAPPSR
jgi:DNA-binding NarL/FixJ family response regulator